MEDKVQMTVAEQAVKQAKNFRSTLEVLVAVIGCMVYLNVWWSDLVVSKREFLMATTEIRLGQVEYEILNYQRLGVTNLSAQDKHQYELLVKAEGKLNETRDRLMGLTQ